MQTVSSAERLRQLVKPTTFLCSEQLDELAGCKVVLASETFQRTGSFKFRAAFNAAQNMPQQTLIAASSGNFGQALAYSCKLLAKRCIIVMPHTSAQVKIESVKSHGGTVELVDVSIKSRAERVAELAAQHADSGVVSAYDDDFVIEGNATLGEELARAQDQFDCVVVPVGGGGLLAGTLKAMQRERCNKPVYGAEPLIANDAARSLKEGQIVKNPAEPQTVADGVRTLALGGRNWEIIKDRVAGIIEVPEENIVAAVKALFFKANLKVEPTGALTLAAVLSDKERFSTRRVCCIVSGGNVDPAVLFQLLA